MDASTLFLGVLFSSIGLGFFIYGRKQQQPVPLLCGLALMIYPYFVSTALPLAAIGTVLTVLPYFLRL